MTDGFDYDYVIIEDDVFTIIRNGIEYTYDVESQGNLIDGARENGVPIIDNREWEQWSGWDTYVEGYDEPENEKDDW